MANENLYVALRDGFARNEPGAVAIETADTPVPLAYTWRDIERATAMFANLLDSLDLPPASRIAVQTEKSVEALLLYLAVLRAGHVYLPLNNAYQAAELEYFIGNAEPAVVVCSSKSFGWLSKIAFKAGVRNVYTLDEQRGGTLLDRASFQADTHEPAQRTADDLAAILYTSGTTGRSKGAMLTHGNLLSNARVLKDYWGWQPGDVLIHALPIFHVHGLFVASHGALLNGSKMLWFSKFDPKAVLARFADATVFMGVPTLYVRLLGEARLVARGLLDHAALRRRLGAAAARDLRCVARAQRPHHRRALRHERDGDDHVEPVSRERRRAARRHRRLSAARHLGARARRQRQRLPHGRDRRHRGEGPERLQGLLAHAGKDAPRSSPPTAGSRPATSAASTPTAI